MQIQNDFLKKLIDLRRKIAFGLILIIACALMAYSKSFMTIAFGICIFIFAINLLNQALSGLSIIENFLHSVTSSKFKSFLFGFITTFIMQSSGLVSVLAISFLSAGLIGLSAGLAIICGANLGTVSGGWLFALGLKTQIAYYAMPLIILGSLFLFTKNQNSKSFGYFLFSLGLLFLGIHYMKGGFEEIKETVDLAKYAMSGFGGLLIYTFVGIVITILTQSSHATLALVIAALGASQISYENAIAIAIGSNIGSTIVAVIGSLSANFDGKKLMLGHVIFNVATAILVIALIKYFVLATDLLSAYVGIKSDDYAIKLAVFHTIFNTFGCMIFYPLISKLEILLNKIITGKVKRAKIIKAKFLDENAQKVPNTAFILLIKEMGRLYSNTVSIVAKSISISKNDLSSELGSAEIIAKRSKPKEINFDELYENRFKELYSQITDYLIGASANAKDSDLARFMNIRRASLLLAETLKDVKLIQPNIFKFMSSSNEHIRAEYDKLRAKIVKMLRIMESLRDFEIDSKEGMKELRALFEEYRKSALAPDKLLAEKLISNKMATSLMNDMEIVNEITSRLLKIVEITFNYGKENDDFEIIRDNLRPKEA
ncbi:MULTISPECIES: Na/Pi cotransporter family protein [unclassified Campylobacter]|uniref:Na/Pi cotransporter family protein n=1 Tax=unclassified Campylobacter TaxID=2593542 RepID=UPI0022E9B963|nr:MULTISPECIES: Na/Pi symporter [unclassified Campylobacter]MDA3043018.1 Na/Pi symporter [Campylobacter sp. JMF_09 ED2]MDA3044944.1 Na/Pi symporter [Campylobacter sp. JMF_07 ED4]MDA3063980.1 Na/Pi symporter [Campylobacter sp. JMF_11 EL3]MDA3072306.1 Na/Pi symporter [Campylobacter sp. VBCF_03 NA9]MDA3074989.1 Na/Pi symporter [Campylobacter sp. JMF_05 ED3]